MSEQRLLKQLDLLMELDRLKSVLRRTRVKSADGRLENTAEHSWHVAVMAILLEEYANSPVDLTKVIKMLLLHDIVEIDAGDTFVYDVVASESQNEKELLAADRLFGMLPDDQRDELRAIWDEFEAAQSAEAVFAKGLDRMIPLIMNFNNQGQSWKEHGIKKEQVIHINGKIEKGSAQLWQHAQQIIEQAVENGWLKP